MKQLIGLFVALAISVGGIGAVTTVAEAGNPHCAGVSDNINLPSGHVNNFGGCK